MNLKNTILAGLFLIGTLGSYSSYVVADKIIDEYEASIWDRMRRDFHIDYESSEREIQGQRAYYLRNSQHLETILERSAPFLYLITEELEKRNLPAELALIPIVESAYNPRAVSASNAAGLWQMIPSTANYFGVKQNNSYDGRHDIYTSTRAALDYLSYLNKKYKGDWLLTIAAYNAGDGNVDRAIARNRRLGKPTDYWSLSNAKMQTRPYVQRIIALADIIDNAEEYGIELPAIPNRPALILVSLNQPVDLNRAAKIAGISLSELYAINPGYKNRHAAATPAQGPHHLLLPVDSVKPFTKNIAQLNRPVDVPVKTRAMMTAENDLRKVSYKVQQGDSLNKIAKLFKTSIQELLSWNNIAKPSLLKPGQVLTVYIP